MLELLGIFIPHVTVFDQMKIIGMYTLPPQQISFPGRDIMIAVPDKNIVIRTVPGIPGGKIVGPRIVSQILQDFTHATEINLFLSAVG
jgi:hypothetical protein